MAAKKSTKKKTVVKQKSVATKQLITEDTVLGKILQKEGAAQILMKHNLPCMTCPMAQMEMNYLKLGEVCQRYGLDAKAVLKELNGK